MEALLTAIQGVDCSARRCAAALAVLGAGAPVAAVATIAGLEVEAAERAADRLAAAGLFAARRPLAFASSELHAATYALVEPGARAVYHRRAAAYLGAEGARHALAVEPAGDDAVAAALVAAGEHALSAGDPERAAGLLERALAEPPAAPDVARALLADALVRIGDARAPAYAAGDPDAHWLSGADALFDSPPPGIAACDRRRPLAEAIALAHSGTTGESACERCFAIAVLIACDELDAAAAALERCVAIAEARGARAELERLETLRGRLAAVRDGDPGGAPLLRGPDPGPEPWPGLPSARAVGGGIDQHRCAVALLRASPRRGALASALLDLGRALRHAGARVESRAVLREGLDLAVRIGASDLAAQCRDELRVAGARPRRAHLSGPESLTAAEQRVVDVAAAGLTNREIAARLFLSHKTVEMHLGRAYRKLGIASRAQLPVAA